MLAEVEQTVDQVLIINHGKLVVESSLEQLTARVGGSIRVRTPTLGKLREALRQEGIEATTVNRDRGCWCTGLTSEKLGDLAFAAGVPIYELVAEGSSLRGVFPGVDDRVGGEAVIAQTQAELLKIRSTRTTIGIVLGMIALILLFSLLSGLLTKPPHLTSTEDQRGLLSVEQHCRGLLGVGRDHARDQRVSLIGTKCRPTFLLHHRGASIGWLRPSSLPACSRESCSASSGEGIGFAIGYATLTGRGIDYALRRAARRHCSCSARWPRSHSGAPSASASA